MQISETALPSIPRMGDMQDTASAAAAAAAVATVAPETEVKMEGIKNENEVGDGGGDKNEDEKEEALPEDANETIYIQNLNEKVKLSGESFHIIPVLNRYSCAFSQPPPPTPTPTPTLSPALLPISPSLLPFPSRSPQSIP